MKYTVHQLAKIAGVTTRTLHYYDEIGLLRPSFVESNSYRYYEEKELAKLQQILFFRELEFSLVEIIKIVNSSGYNAKAALNDQKKLLEMKRVKIDTLLMTIDKTLKGGGFMKNDDLFNGFSDYEMNKYKEEAKKRWGNTDAYKQSMQRTKNWTKADYKKIQAKTETLTKKLAGAMDLDIKSPQVQELVAQHHKGIEVFYDCSYAIYRGLADMYVADPRFTAYYDKHKPGLAKWLQKAIHYYCDQHKDE